jgi:bile acid:Na+ symporter, BASS family
MLNAFFDWFARALVGWVLLALGIGYFFPKAFALLPAQATNYFFALTMFGIGALLTPGDFAVILRRPVPIFLGVLAQFAIMPLLGLVIARALDLPPGLAVGLILVGAVPDAMASGVISYLADANVAFSVGLTCATTLVSPVVTPWLILVLGKTLVEIQFWPMFGSILSIVIAPLFAGLSTRILLKERISRIEKLFPALSTLFIAFICGQVIAVNKARVEEVGLVVLLAVCLMNILGLILGYLAGKLFRFDLKYRRTLAINVAMQNAGLGAILASKHISAEAAIPNALFATWCIVTGSILARVWNKSAAPGDRGEAARKAAN